MQENYIQSEMHKKDNFQTDNFCIPAFKNVDCYLELKACNTIRKILCIIITFGRMLGTRILLTPPSLTLILRQRLDKV